MLVDETKPSVVKEKRVFVEIPNQIVGRGDQTQVVVEEAKQSVGWWDQTKLLPDGGAVF